MGLESKSTEELLEELRKRQAIESKSIEERVKEMTPKPIENPDLSSLTKLCEEYIKSSMDDDYVDDDMDNWMTETAMQTIMGRDVYERLRAAKKLRDTIKK